MGTQKSTTNTTTEQKATATPEETRLNQLDINMREKTDPLMAETQTRGLGLINQLLLGGSNLPGFFGDMGKGIDENMTQDIVKQSLRDLYPQFQNQGILDSGTAASVAGRTAGDIRTNVAEYNLNNKLNLLNLAFSGQGQVQQPVLNQSSILSQRLAGLRTVNNNVQSSTKNPFTGASLGVFGKWGASYGG
jgi:hypothetical protein